jgi:hypothetical protein
MAKSLKEFKQLLTDWKVDYVDFNSYSIKFKSLYLVKVDENGNTLSGLGLNDSLSNMTIGRDFIIEINIDYYRRQLVDIFDYWNPNLTQDLLDLIVENIEKENNLIAYYHNRNNLMSVFDKGYTFSWGYSPQGYEFWEDVYLKKRVNIKLDMPEMK